MLHLTTGIIGHNRDSHVGLRPPQNDSLQYYICHSEERLKNATWESLLWYAIPNVYKESGEDKTDRHVILSETKNLVGVEKTMEIISHRFLTYVRNDRTSGHINLVYRPQPDSSLHVVSLRMTLYKRDSHVATALLLGMTNYNAPRCHSEECIARRGSLSTLHDRGNSRAQILHFVRNDRRVGISTLYIVHNQILHSATLRSE